MSKKDKIDNATGRRFGKDNLLQREIRAEHITEDDEKELRLLNKNPKSLKAIVGLLQYQLVVLIVLTCIMAAIFIGGVTILLIR